MLTSESESYFDTNAPTFFDDDQLDWKSAHHDLVRLAKTQAGLDIEVGRSLLAAFHSAAHERLGCGSFAEYAGRIFGWTPRMVTERLRVADPPTTPSIVPVSIEVEPERAAFEEAFRAHDGDTIAMASALGVARPTVYKLMKRYGLVPVRKRKRA